MTELKPCPFCGGQPDIAVSKYGKYVTCPCSLNPKTDAFEDVSKAIEQWNTRANSWHTGTPTEREWVLGIFREADTGWINPIPFVCEYLQGLKTKATTEEGWIIKDCTDIDQPCDYYKKLQCIAWMKIEPFKEKEE